VTRREQTVSLIRSLREAHGQAFGRRPRRGKVPPPVRPTAIQAEYLRGIRDVVLSDLRAAMERVRPELAAWVAEADRERNDFRGRVDASSDKAAKLIERLAAQMLHDVTPEQIARLSWRIGKRTSDYQRDELRRQIKAAVGVDPLMREPASIGARIEHFTAENVALIKKIPAKFFGEIEQVVYRGVRMGTRAEGIAETLQERYGVAESDAARIARDQVGKFFGEMNKVRQEALGIDAYTWHTMEDNRVRDEHDAIDGTQRLWTESPIPGEEINCRCWPEPDLTEIMAGL